MSSQGLKVKKVLTFIHDSVVISSLRSGSVSHPKLEFMSKASRRSTRATFHDFTASRRIMFTVGSVDRLSSECRPTIVRVSTDYRPTIDRVSTDYRPLYQPTDRSTIPTVNMIPIVKGTSWNLRDLTSHRQGVFDKKGKKLNSRSAKNWRTPSTKIYAKSRPYHQTLLKP